MSPASVALLPDVPVLVVLVVVPAAFLVVAYKLMQGLLAYDRSRGDGS